MKDLFKKQLENDHHLTEEELSQLINKSYFNGDPYKVGDVILYAFLLEGKPIEPIEFPTTGPITRETEPTDLKIQVISLNEDHFDLFETDVRFPSYDNTPTIKLK
jgi:hypothetical protein